MTKIRYNTGESRKSAGRAIDRVQPSAEEKIRYGSQGLKKLERERMIKAQRARASLGGPKPPPSTVKKSKKKS